jgi:hypothetical protein
MLAKESKLERRYVVTPGKAYVTVKIYYALCVLCVCSVDWGRNGITYLHEACRTYLM